MQRDLIEDLRIFEETDDFWTLARNDILLKYINQEPIFDVGCGSGILTKALISLNKDVYSLDVDKRACELTKKFNKKVICKSFDKIKPKDTPKLGTIVLADVIEHVENDLAFLKIANSILKEKGEILISVPYSMALWTKNDVARGHFRRYSKKELKEKLEASGFRVQKMILWNALSVFVILLAKIFGSRVPHEGISKSKMNKFLLSYFRKFENKLPPLLGSTLICKAIKNGI